MRLGNRFFSAGGAAVFLVASVLTFSGVATARPGKIHPAPADAIAGQYVVVLKASNAEVKSNEFTGMGAKVRYRYTKALSGLAVQATPDQLDTIANDPDVEYVIQDTRIHADFTQPVPSPSNTFWGLDRIDERSFPLDNTYRYVHTGIHVHAYVIDTGLEFSHPQFGGRASFGIDTVGDFRAGDDCNGHGTHVGGTIGGSTYGVAKRVQLVAVRVLDCYGAGDASGVIAGIDWVTANAIKPAVANMSVGGAFFAPLNGAVKNSIASGVQYSVAAGNSNANACGYSPASTPEAVTVGATGNYSKPADPRSDVRGSFSNFGSCLDIFAPGVFIKSAWLNSGTTTISGTSMAAPHVTGVLALLLAVNPGLSPSALRDKLIELSTKNKVGNPGTGSPNRLLFIYQ